MNEENMKYMKNKNNFNRVIRAELLFMPLLIVVPLIVGILLVHDWFTRGYLLNDSSFNSSLIIGIVVLVGNIIFDIPFIKSLKAMSSKKT